MDKNKIALIVILTVVFLVILAVIILVAGQLRSERVPERAAETLPLGVESMEDIDITVWGFIIPSPEYIRASSIILLSEGSSLYSGYCYHNENFDYSLTMLDKGGNILWQKAYGGERSENLYGNVAETPDGGFIFAGSTNTFTEGINWDCWVIKVDRAGEVLWSRVIGYPKNFDSPAAIKVLPGGGYILAAYTTAVSRDMRENWWIMKLDAQGNILWQRAYGGMLERDTPRDIIQTSDGGFICVGKTSSYGEGSDDAWIIKFDRVGAIEWQETLGGPKSDQARSVIELPGKGYVIAGSTGSAGRGEEDGWIIFLDQEGKSVWQHLYGTAGYDWLSSIILADDGTFLAVGGCTPEDGGTADGLLMRLDSEGNPLWLRSYGGPGIEYISSVVETDDGGLIALGRSRPVPPEDAEGEFYHFILKLSSDGRPVYRRTVESTFGDPVEMEVVDHTFPPVITEVYPWDTKAKSTKPDTVTATDIEFPVQQIFLSVKQGE